jgi:anti-sigma factor RsiW
MKCTRPEEILIEYCAGTLSSETAAELKSHISGCPECRSFTQSQQQVWAALDQWETEPISSDFNGRIYKRIAETERPSPWRGWLAWRPVLGVAAACAAVVIALVVNSPGDRQVAITPPAAAAHVESSRAESVEPEQMERALEDLEMLDQLSSSSVRDL